MHQMDSQTRKPTDRMIIGSEFDLGQNSLPDLVVDYYADRMPFKFYSSFVSFVDQRGASNY